MESQVTTMQQPSTKTTKRHRRPKHVVSGRGHRLRGTSKGHKGRPHGALGLIFNAHQLNCDHRFPNKSCNPSCYKASSRRTQRCNLQKPYTGPRPTGRPLTQLGRTPPRDLPAPVVAENPVFQASGHNQLGEYRAAQLTANIKMNHGSDESSAGAGSLPVSGLGGKQGVPELPVVYCAIGPPMPSKPTPQLRQVGKLPERPQGGWLPERLPSNEERGDILQAASGAPISFNSTLLPMSSDSASFPLISSPVLCSNTSRHVFICLR